jgi:hypothetical protein
MVYSTWFQRNNGGLTSIVISAFVDDLLQPDVKIALGKVVEVDLPDLHTHHEGFPHFGGDIVRERVVSVGDGGARADDNFAEGVEHFTRKRDQQ